jgi:hypothetical protein
MKRLPAIVFLLVLIAFGFGLVHLLNLRFERGDSYPPYSSLRADPLGSKALFESLDSLVPTRRHLQSLSKLGEGRDTTLLWLGADASDTRFEREDYKRFDAFVRTGGRLIFAFHPVARKPLPNPFLTRGTTRGGRGGTPTNVPPVSSRQELEDLPGIPMERHWDFALAHEELPKDELRHPVPVSALLLATNETPALPATLATHTTLFFEQLSPDWRIIYARATGTNEQPVLVERRFGRGSIVLAADSYPFSNEAMLKDREAALLAWFLGGKGNVVFDETHLGVSQSPGIATLARKYRLHGLFAGLLILAALFIWKNAASFMPPHDEQLAHERGGIIEGKDSAAGFVNLLRRSISPADLLKVCLEQWNAHSASGRKPTPAKLEAMQAIIDEQNALEPRRRDAVATYRRFCDILRRTGKRET